MASNLNQPGESGAYRDVKDYTGATAEPFEKQIEANKKKRQKFLQGDLFNKVEKLRKSNPKTKPNIT